MYIIFFLSLQLLICFCFSFVQNNAGGYAEIDNLEDIKDINEGMNNVKLYDELDDIPDIEANPYTGQNPYSNGNDRGNLHD